MKRSALLVLVLLAAASACTTVNVTPTEHAAVPAGASAAKSDSSTASRFKPWAEATRDTRTVAGLFTLHVKRDRTLYGEIRPDQLDKDFGIVMHISRGVGDYDLHDGLPLSEMRLVRFHRVGDRLYLVHRNPRFTAETGSPMQIALDDNTGHSTIGVFKIESEHSQTKHLLVDLTGFFVSDYADVGSWLKYAFEQKPVLLENDRSYVERVMGFPQNVEIDASLTFRAPDVSPFGTEALSDYRFIPVGVRYSLIALPERPMAPRLADDRVGYFVDAVLDFSRDRAVDPYVRYVNRWRLEKKDPTAAISEPVKPIVFYIDPSVPTAYRPYVKEGIEAWNKGFERAGFKHAIQAVEAPDDTTWSAEDARYSTVRWTAAYRMGYAIGPSQTDPRTGEVLNADILVSSEFTRYWTEQYQELADPDALRRLLGGPRAAPEGMPAALQNRLCTAGMTVSRQLGFQYAALVGLGVIAGGAPMPEELLGAGIRELIMHEVGHTLGLRHNFKGSSGIPNDRLNDRAYTQEHGVSLSVMDYAPVNIALDPEKQGYYWSPEIGSYDVWAIRYAYTPVAGQAVPGLFAALGTSPEAQEAEPVLLRTIAAEGTDPFHAYNTDEDNWLGPFAVDPLTNAGDLGSDPLQYARDRAALVRKVQPNLEARLIEEGEGYQRLRSATTGLLYERMAVLLPLTKQVGGLYFARDHRGDPDQRAPFTPVPAERQREAVRLIAQEAFAPEAFRFDSDLLNKLAPNRHAHWGQGWGSVPVDYPIHGFVGALQGMLLEDLLHPARLQRMLDNEVRMPGGSEAYRISELFETLTGAVWQELDPSGSRVQPINSFRRNLQRIYAEGLIRLLLDAPPFVAYGMAGMVPVPVPEHARSLARLELLGLSERIGQALASGADLDRDTQAHLVESKARIDQGLETSLTRPIR